jgi:chromosome partitioning protein
MGKIIAIANQKGGVGKSTITFNLSTFLSERYKKKVLTIDLDTQGNISNTLIEGCTPTGSVVKVMKHEGLQTKDLFKKDLDLSKLRPMQASHGIDLVYTESNDLSLSKSVFQNLDEGSISPVEGMKAFDANVKKLAEDYDFVIMDFPPFIGDHVLSALLVCDYAISPVLPVSYCLEGITNFLASLKLVHKEDCFLGVILNNVDKSWVNHQATADKLKERLQNNIYKTVLYHRSPYDKSQYSNTPLYTQQAWRVAAEEFDSFVRETIDRINKKDICNISLD